MRAIISVIVLMSALQAASAQPVWNIQDFSELVDTDPHLVQLREWNGDVAAVYSEIAESQNLEDVWLAYRQDGAWVKQVVSQTNGNAHLIALDFEVIDSTP
jgi:hypothetical protein